MSFKATRTTNPLHFEDLEPHRFEDLVRQLAYDFRTWKRLEPTGRLGSDDGVDIRGIESFESLAEPDEESEEEVVLPERTWLFQCKREKALGPTKVKNIVKDGVPEGSDPPYGYILVAACDISKKARDAFHSEALLRGVTVSYVWGKADLEDMLFQPKNDHLLFAYFGISIQVRRRSLKLSVRSRLTTKRAAIKAFGPLMERRLMRNVLLLDPTDERYPNLPEEGENQPRARWKYYKFEGHFPPNHLMFEIGNYFAYVDDERMHWDAMFDFNDLNAEPAQVALRQDPKITELRTKYWEEWLKLPERNRAWFKLRKAIHYDRILAFDVDGDTKNPGPHLLVEFDEKRGPFENFEMQFVEFGNILLPQKLRPNSENRVHIFSSPLPSASDTCAEEIQE